MNSSAHYIGAPFGGTKNSGLGREESTEELLSYLQARVIHAQMRSVTNSLAGRRDRTEMITNN